MRRSALVPRSFVLLAIIAVIGCRDDHTPRAPAPTPARDAGAVVIGHAARAAQLVARFPAARVTRIALDEDGYAYVTELFGNQVFKLRPAPGATPTVLYRSPSRGTWGVAVLGDDVLWSSNDTGRIYAAPRSGAGPIRVVADNLPGIGAFRLAGDTLYWTDMTGGTPGTVWKRPLRGGPSVAITTPAKRADDVLVDDGRLLVADDGSNVLAVGSDGQVTPWFTAPELQFTSLAEDDRFVYAVCFGGELLRIAKDTRAADYLLEYTGTIYEGIALDRDHIYLLDYKAPALVSLPR
jgi:hypothetical protein